VSELAGQCQNHCEYVSYVPTYMTPNRYVIRYVCTRLPHILVYQMYVCNDLYKIINAYI
jgi:hypothetical protein